MCRHQEVTISPNFLTSAKLYIGSMERYRTIIDTITILSMIALTTVFTQIFIFHYIVWKSCYDEVGDCYDPSSQTEFLDTAGLIYGFLAIISFIFSVVTYAKKIGLHD